MGIALLIAVLGWAGLTAESASQPLPQRLPQPPPQIPWPNSAAVSTPSARVNELLNREAFVLAARAGGYSQIWAHLPGDPLAYQLTTGKWDNRDPAVSPGMNNLAFASRRGGSWDLHILDLESGQLRQLTDTLGYEGNPTWSPDGQWIAFEAYYGDNFDIWILPLDGSQPAIKLTDHPGVDLSPAWDPGGRRIAFISDRDGSPDLFLADLDKPTDRFVNLSHTREIAEQDPAFNPAGSQLAFGLQIDGVSGIQRMALDGTSSSPEWVGQGSDPVWSANGAALSGLLKTPYAAHIVTYPLEDSAFPIGGTFSGRITELQWSPQTFPALIANVADPPEPLFQPVVDNANSTGGRTRLVSLQGVNPVGLRISDAADEAFQALRRRVLDETGWDFLSNLEHAFVGINDPLPPGFAYNDWLYTGRAFSISEAAFQAGWVEVVREDFGLETYWRVYVRTSVQDGSMGEPLQAAPWDFTSRFIGDPVFYDAGGAAKERIPAGYYADFTALAADYGFERVPALRNWRSFYPGARFDEFALREGTDWTSAMLELYPASAIATPTPYQTPTPTPSNTPRPTPTPWWWRWRTPTPSPELTPTP